MNRNLTIIDLLSIICFYLTLEGVDYNKMLKEHLIIQDKKLDKILEVLKDDNR